MRGQDLRSRNQLIISLLDLESSAAPFSASRPCEVTASVLIFPIASFGLQLKQSQLGGSDHSPLLFWGSLLP
jgi:hypothetical protein